MDYNRIIAVTGLPGLFELLSSKTDGAIVRALDDNTTRFVSSRIHNFSHLESIEIYTVRDNVNLVDVFQAMEKSAEKMPDGKDAGAVKAYFKAVYPDMDFERVYASDMKKMIKWLEILQKNKVDIKLTEAPAEEESATAAEPETTPVVIEETSPAKKKTAPKKAAEKETAEKEAATDKKAAAKESTETAEKPKKPAAKKKKSEE